MRHFATPLALLGLFACTASAQAKPEFRAPYPDGKVATVSAGKESQTIFTWDVMKKLADLLPGLRNTFPDDDQFQSALRDLFDKQLINMIGDVVIQMKARAHHIEITDRQLDEHELEDVRELADGDREKFKALLSQKGQTMTGYREELRARILGETVLYSSPQFSREALFVAPQDIRAYYRNNPGEFKHPRRLKARIITFEAARAEARDRAQRSAEAVLRQVRDGGADFEKLAQWSDKTPATPLGEPGWRLFDDLEKPLAEALFAAKPGDLVGPIAGEQFVYVAKATVVEEAHAETFEQAQEGIARKLRAVKIGAAIQDATKKLLAEAVIEAVPERVQRTFRER